MRSVGKDPAFHSGVVELDALVIGAGFHGLYLLHALRQAGFEAELWEAQNGPGGVWRAHQYPGCRVDIPVPGYQYSMEEVWNNWKWKGKYPNHDELRDYFDFVTDKLQLRRDIRFDTKVVEADFDIDSHHWLIKSANGFTCRSRFLLPCLGFITTPYIPDIAGKETFQGVQCHAVRWPNNFEVRNKSVGVIGTSSTGTQLVERIAPEVKHLTLFQRTPNINLPAGELTVSPDIQRPECLRSFFADRPDTPAGAGIATPLPVNATDVSPEEREAHYEKLYEEGSPKFLYGNYRDLVTSLTSNRWVYEFWRRKVHARVTDPHVAEILAPETWPHPVFAKRPSFETGYFEIFNQANVDLIDLPNDQIVRIVPTGIVTSSSGLHGLDAIIYASGFNAIHGWLGTLRVTGVDKTRTLKDEWEGPDGYPNMLLGAGPQSMGVKANGSAYSEIQGKWMTELLSHVRDSEQFSTFDVKYSAAQEWKRTFLEQPLKTLTGSSPSWQDGGNIPGARREPQYWSGSLQAYVAIMEECQKGGYKEFDFH